MNTLLERIADNNNLYWAWNKAKNIYQPGDIWFDELDVARFEANLAEELNSIRQSFLDGTYRLEPLFPVAYPKSPNERGPRTRQTFWVAVRDQVAWLAVVNVIGGYIDAKMPFWSYGNRLYLTIFYDHSNNDNNERRYGYYRNTTRNLYRKWTQSWPMYRQHINLTARLMSKPEEEVRENAEEVELELLDNNKKLESEHPMQNKYLLDDYWKGAPQEKLYWAGIDLEKFYPNIKLEAIKKNIREALPKKDVTDEFWTLLDSMLNFELNLNRWSKKDLKDVTLTPGAKQYDHLPTGLFVAGFLANTALLEIDTIVKRKLDQRNDVAHFRFVDDHVILASSFEVLKVWIDEYEQLLKTNDVGAQINLTKTIPQPLAVYYHKKGKVSAEKARKLYKAAAKACELDPDFPNPLMTQTLAKVSRIARTDFNLLSPEEEKTLIADVEHLLITDFPDHELRRDTRVSFAARMLSNMIPKMTGDTTRLYQHHRDIALKNKLLEDYEKAMKVALDIDGDEQEAEKLKLNIEKVTAELLNHKKELKEEKDKLKREETRLGQRTLKMLTKAVHENHDKVRLWGRLLEFFHKSGSEDAVSITKEMTRLVDDKISSPLSITFIRSLVLQVLANLMLDAIKILHSVSYSHKRKDRTVLFIQGVLSRGVQQYFYDSVTGRSKPYEQVSLRMFQCACGTVVHLLKTEFPERKIKLPADVVKKYKLVNWERSPQIFFKQSGVDAGTWGWWLVDKLPAPKIGSMPLLWSEIEPHLLPLRRTDLHLLLRYPRHLTNETLLRLQAADNQVLAKNEGVLFDIASARKEIIDPLPLLKDVSKKLDTNAGRISLYDWVEWTREQSLVHKINDHERMVFDPRLGEWTALLLTEQIGNCLQKAMTPVFDMTPEEIDYSRLIHANNFELPGDWIKQPADPLTWEMLADWFKKEQIVLRPEAERIVDNRFQSVLEPNVRKSFEFENQAILNGMGSLLVSLLAKTTMLPDKWNSLGQQQAWLSLARHKLQDVAVSTYTRDILSGCFSKRNLETQLFLRLRLSEDFGFPISDDTSLDPPSIIDLPQFLELIRLAIKRLKGQQISVAMHQPRQLTPVSLLRVSQDAYKEMKDGRNKDNNTTIEL